VVAHFIHLNRIEKKLGLGGASCRIIALAIISTACAQAHFKVVVHHDFKRTAFTIWKATVSPTLHITSAAPIRSGRHAY
jgi:hypothetical protein